MKKGYPEGMCEVELVRVDYDLDSPSDEGSLLVRVGGEREEILCCDTDCGGHYDLLKPGKKYGAFFTAFGMVRRADDGERKIRIKKNRHEGIDEIRCRVSGHSGGWLLCDAGFPVSAMSASGNEKEFSCGDMVVISGGLRVELVFS